MPVLVCKPFLLCFSQLLSRLTQNPEPRVRELVCSSLVTLLDKASTHLKPFLPSLTDFFLNVGFAPIVYTLGVRGCCDMRPQLMLGRVSSQHPVE